jgi:tRNA dimethylallyltransferase
MIVEEYNLITILGPTATGKTAIAAHLAKELKSEIISADSRQVYRGMDIGTGKDLEEYTIEEVKIPYHLIDIVDAGYEYNIFEYQRDFIKVFDEISERKKTPILCGGSGLYIETVLNGYKLINVPVNESLRTSLIGKTLEELSEMLKNFKNLHNKTDVDTVKRAIRAIEIEEYYLKNPETDFYYPKIKPIIIGIMVERDIRRKRISERLVMRVKGGMIDEVKTLLNQGVKPETLIYYGLEYKFITKFIVGEIGYHEMFSGLETAIHQFAKRQMTWFRHMEKNGFTIHWIDGMLPMDSKIEQIMRIIK